MGGICVHTHVVGPQVKEMVASYRSGDVERAHALDEELRPAIEILRVQTNPIAIKKALQLLGHEVGGLRLPLVEADEAETPEIRSCLEQLGLRRRARGVAPTVSPSSTVRRLRSVRRRSGSSRSAASARSART